MFTASTTADAVDYGGSHLGHQLPSLLPLLMSAAWLTLFSKLMENVLLTTASSK